MTYQEWHERCLYGASLLRQDAKALERAIRNNASDSVCECIMQRIADDLKRARTSRKLIKESEDGVEVIQ